MRGINIALVLAAAVAAVGVPRVEAQVRSTPTEQEIIDALLPSAADPGKKGRTRAMSGDRGVRVSGDTETGVPSIDLEVNFAFDSTRLDNESMLTLDVLGRALSSDALKGQTIEIVGHTDAKGTQEYNDALSQRRAAAVVSYLVVKFPVDGALLSSKGMGERELLDADRPEAAANRRVEIRNVTRSP